MSVKIYTKANCIFCEKAKDFIKQRKFQYTEFKLGKDFERDWIREAFPSMKTYPIILIDEVLVGGYDDLFERFNDPGLGQQYVL
jgi:glutaredoxin